jgi:hypothetical protein
LRKEWEAVRADFTRISKVTLAINSDDQLEALEAGVLAFINRYMAETADD